METNSKPTYKTIDEYHATFSLHIRDLLEVLRKTIKEAAPEAEEVISYQMPAFKWKGMLVYYAAWKNHIAIYPASQGVKIFEEELAAYETSKGTIKFPIDQPLPLDLISRIVRFRVKENEEKAKAKGKGKNIRKGK